MNTSKLTCRLVSPSGRLILFDGLYSTTIYSAFLSAKTFSVNINDHLYHLQHFFLDLLANGYHEDTSHSFQVPDLNVFFDFPASYPKRRLNLLTHENTIICEIENPLYTLISRPFYSHFKIISPYLHSPWLKSHTSYVYAAIPTSQRNNLPAKFKTPSLTSIVCSNLAGPRPFLYDFRRHVINAFSLFGDDQFSFFGKGWINHRFLPEPPLKSFIGNTVLSTYRNYKRSISQYLLGYPKCDMSCFKGVLDSKEILHSFLSTLAIENTVNVPGYSTEKALEPLIYGCYPVYIGTNVENYLSSYLDILPVDVLSLLASVSSLQQKPSYVIRLHAEEIKTSINNDILSGKVKTTLGLLRDCLLSL
jgi:hypothetical protein